MVAFSWYSWPKVVLSRSRLWNSIRPIQCVLNSFSSEMTLVVSRYLRTGASNFRSFINVANCKVVRGRSRYEMEA